MTRFGSTYEGLKPRSRSGSCTTGRGFGSTYEGLKQRIGVRPVSHGTGFGSTYEGLKLRGGLVKGVAMSEFWQYL